MIYSIFAFRIIRYYPENHIGWDIRWIYFIGFACALGFILEFYKNRPRRPAASIGLGLCLILMASIFILDHYHILVAHGVWVRRGMPGPFE